MNEKPKKTYRVDTNISHIFVYNKDNPAVRLHVNPINYERTWIDAKGKPYKYEFRGNDYMGYHNPEDLLIIK